MNKFDALNRALEMEVLRLQIFWIAVLVLTFIIGNWALYHVIRAAIRDGIKESGLVENWKYHANNAGLQRNEKRKAQLPDMRAD
jgi:hypothetical protein